ncbi:hypothetical protein B0J12DRAFT_683924, partial [Macrophomina phaseolina]
MAAISSVVRLRALLATAQAQQAEGLTRVRRNNVCRESRVRLQTGVAGPSAIGAVVRLMGPLQFLPTASLRSPQQTQSQSPPSSPGWLSVEKRVWPGCTMPLLDLSSNTLPTPQLSRLPSPPAFKSRFI